MNNRRTPRITGIAVALAGLLFLAGGVWLSWLGGSPYYAAAGIGLLATGIGLAKGARWSLWVYAAVWLGTLLWSFYEAGLDVWQLEPRLMLPTLLGLYLLLPRVRNRLSPPAPASRVWNVASPVLAVALVGGLFFAHSWPQPSQPVEPAAASPVAQADGSDQSGNDWAYYGRTPRGERWSPLAQITPQNVSKLTPAWEYRTGDLPRKGENVDGYEFNFEVTPTKVGDTLYICTPHSQIIALDAVSGAQKWRFDPKPDTHNNAYLACRGVAYYQAPAPRATCTQRIIAPVADARLVALDAETGKPCEGFGEQGFVSLRAHLGEVQPGFHFVTSPPLVVNDRVILGGWVYDGQKTHEPSGAVRAFDPLTGEMAWAWDVGRPDSPIAHPRADEQFTPGTPNAWGVYTADVARGLVYLPTGNAVPDYYGAQRRPFDEQYSSATVALDIETGRPRWSFQTVHHDLWDMDVPIGPSLVDLPGPGGSTLPALVQTTKRGELFVLNRETGQPISAVEEKPAPQGGLAEERVAKTQPYSVGMPSFAPPQVTEQDTWGITPLDQMLCRIEYKSMDYKGAFTPFTVEKKTLVYPAFDGVIDWHGASVDPEHKRLYANLSYIPFVAQTYARATAEQKGLVEPWDGNGTPPRPKKFAINPQYGTPYVVKVDPWLGIFGAPCKAPPWGQLAAVDLVKRTLLWKHDVGTTRDMAPFGLHTNLPLPTGIFNIGGNIVTRSGLIFMGATADDYLRAFDAGTGAELWRVRLPAGGQATPMTYMGNDGRQYVVIAAGGHGGLQTRAGDYLEAFALPRAGG
ncbi:membrane-bound PQQ-dependent dehydrogenase, glucose/quinate/shikimate family [Pseudomonas typographi]|uniref:membrane-bound PQQ-dependent dehydrogenase, glucose/quinate/shikimate family n=1 Tax=Pseudomonas typographi TaxID=2715964 RepID=UPI0016855A7C|nr:membrane-bound PQQ-dependent dehydrogenase, glucose/quinate/shikimate family [Pseudomonas typographi]MBD1588734.1 membrane-bound PQQ-dependent dehydrogenase, glucose/quinate/shikimate family [Pseudomonas typographi]